MKINYKINSFIDFINNLKQISNKRALVNLYKDIVLVTCVHIFCTTLCTNNNIKIVIKSHTFLFHRTHISLVCILIYKIAYLSYPEDLYAKIQQELKTPQIVNFYKFNNNIGPTKMQHNYSAIKCYIFLFCDCNIGHFFRQSSTSQFYYSLYSYRSSMSKGVIMDHFFL